MVSERPVDRVLSRREDGSRWQRRRLADGHRWLESQEADAGVVRRVQLDRLGHSGTQLAFAGSHGTKTDLWIVGLDGRPERAITTNHVGSFGASWSPDGTKLAYLVEANEFGTIDQVVVARGDGSDPHQLEGDYDWYDPQWSPDGSRLAVVGAGSTGLYLLDPAGVVKRVMIETASSPQSVGANADVASWQRLAP